MRNLTAAELRSLLDYDAETGVFTWRHRPERTQYDKTWNRRFAGREAGTAQRFNTGRWYRAIRVQGRSYLAHRLAFLHMASTWPPHEIDHRDGDGLNNRWMNLRAATRSQNGQNSKPTENNTGLKGAHRYKNGRFVAHITADGRLRHLGYFDTAEEAHEAYAKAAREHFGDFARVS